MKTVKIDTHVPCVSSPAAPCLVFFGTGDWEFCTAYDVEFIGDIVGFALVVDVLNEIAIDCLDEEEMDECDGRNLLVLSFQTEPGSRDECVIGLSTESEWELMLREKAQSLCFSDSSEIFNFIPLIDFFEDLKYWIKHNRKRMAEVQSDHRADLTDLME